MQALLEVVMAWKLRELRGGDQDAELMSLMAPPSTTQTPEQKYQHWLQRVLETSCIINALAPASPVLRIHKTVSDNASSRLSDLLPASFLASTDTFAPYFALASAQTFQSPHPYARGMTPLKGSMEFHDCERVEVHFDPCCNTAPGDTLRIFSSDADRSKPIDQREGDEFSNEILVLETHANEYVPNANIF